MKKKLITLLGLKGSWKWAKKQMLKGYIIKPIGISGALVLRIDSKHNKLLQSCYHRSIEFLNKDSNWESATYFLGKEEDLYFVYDKGEGRNIISFNYKHKI